MTKLGGLTGKLGGLTGMIWAFALLTGSQAQAELAPLKQTAAPGSGARLASQSAEAEIAGDHDKALRLADEAIKADPNEAWGYYDRGDALGALRRVDDAVAAFHEAERRFPEADLWGKSVAIWGQANVLGQAGRCQEAVPLYERYASSVENVDKDAASLARQFAKRCTPRPAGH